MMLALKEMRPRHFEMICVTRFENWHIVGIRNGVDGKFSVSWQPKFVGSIRNWIESCFPVCLINKHRGQEVLLRKRGCLQQFVGL